MAQYGPERVTSKSGKSLTLRHCTAEDVDAFLRFQEKIAADSTHTLMVVGRPHDRSKVLESFETALKDRATLRMGIFDGDQMVANLSLHANQHPWTEHIAAFGMGVIRDYWGEGLGRKLLEALERHARTAGITRIEARVRTLNERGVRLYTRMGYSIEGTRGNAARIGNESHDEYFIAKHLDQDTGWKPPVFRTKRLIVRPLELTDAPAIFAYASNPNVSHFTAWEPHKTIEQSRSFILDYAFPNYRKHTPEPWAIALKTEPETAIGTVGCFWVSRQARTMELAYALSEKHWGQGLMVEAARAAIDHCFREYDVTRIQARCKVENKPSARVMEKLGMKFEGTLRSSLIHRGRDWDMHHYSTLRKEWESDDAVALV